ncbi:hypothetical protein BC332_34595 [Capsicum chinense]|nr:hypothetical protein BC332_34595 [Capsicum chinense]
MDSINLNKFFDKHKDIFGDKAGTLTGPAFDFHFKPGAKPKFCRARPLPYSMLDQYAAQIDEKIKSGFYKMVDHSEWASPTHVVVKNNKLRITGDYKTTLNPNLIIDDYPIPRPEELFAKIRGCKYFCKLDVKDAFMHLRCSQAACEAMTLNTPTHGLIQPTRAQYGVSNIPAAWQRRLEQILKDKHVQAIVQAKKPESAEEFRTFLGKVTYYHSFIDNLSTRTYPLRQMLQTSHFEWTKAGLAAYEDIKSELISDKVKFRPSKQNANADYLSRSINGNYDPTDDLPHHFHSFVSAQIDQLPLSTEAIAFETQQDPELSTLFQALEQGKDLKTLGFKGNQLEYCIVQGCLMLGHRVVIPPKFRQKLLDELHLAHLGITKMKGIARTIIYWHNIDKDIEKFGIPDILVTDIGPQFTSAEFQSFLSNQGVRFRKESHPTTQVQTDKQNDMCNQ